MNTEKEAQAAGEKLKELLLRMLIAREKVTRKLDGSQIQQEQTEFVDSAIKCVHEEILPKYDGVNLILYSEGRSTRSFEFEFDRLWAKAQALYLEDSLRSFTPEIESFLRNPDYALIRQRYRDELIRQIEALTVPLLEKHDTPGDDLYLFTCELMRSAGEEATIESIANTGKTPPELISAFYCMFGLLMQAKKAKQDGDISRAYTFLLDANHLVGMCEGARYAMKHLPEVAAKRRAKVNAEKSRAKTNEAKLRSVELFYSLRPTSKDGKPLPWKSANEAMKVVWNALLGEAQAEGKANPDIKDSTLLTLCQQLHKRDKEGSSLDIRVEVVQLLPDGTEIRVPVD